MRAFRFRFVYVVLVALVLSGCSLLSSPSEESPRRQQLRRELRLKRLVTRFKVLPAHWQLCISDSTFHHDPAGRFYCNDQQLLPVDNRLISPCLNVEGLRNARGIVPTQFFALGQVPVPAGPKPLLMVAPIPTGYVLVWAQAEATEHPPSMEALAVLDTLYNPTLRAARLQVPGSGVLHCSLLPTDTAAAAHTRVFVSGPQPRNGFFAWRMAAQ
jgi:uncharacterized protein YceK